MTKLGDMLMPQPGAIRPGTCTDGSLAARSWHIRPSAALAGWLYDWNVIDVPITGRTWLGVPWLSACVPLSGPVTNGVSTDRSRGPGWNDATVPTRPGEKPVMP